jgi:hypothetical protein
MNFVVILVTAVMLAAASGYGWAQSPTKSPQTEGASATGAAVKAQETCTPAERKAYEKKMTEELKAIDAKIGDLRLKTTKVPPQQKRMMLSQMQYLYKVAAIARNQLNTLVISQGEAWNQAQANLAETMQDLTRSLGVVELKY